MEAWTGQFEKRVDEFEAQSDDVLEQTTVEACERCGREIARLLGLKRVKSV